MERIEKDDAVVVASTSLVSYLFALNKKNKNFTIDFDQVIDMAEAMYLGTAYLNNSLLHEIENDQIEKSEIVAGIIALSIETFIEATESHETNREWMNKHFTNVEDLEEGKRYVC